MQLEPYLKALVSTVNALRKSREKTVVSSLFVCLVLRVKELQVSFIDSAQVAVIYGIQIKGLFYTKFIKSISSVVINLIEKREPLYHNTCWSLQALYWSILPLYSSQIKFKKMLLEKPCEAVGKALSFLTKQTVKYL